MKIQEKKREASGINVGSASLLMVFCVLCLTIFAVLAVVTARAEWNLTQKTAAATTAYYDADARAVEILDAVREGYAFTGALIWPEEVAVEMATFNGKDSIVFREPIDAQQELIVQLYADEGTVEVASWMIAVTGTWEPEGTLDVWDGSLPGELP